MRVKISIIVGKIQTSTEGYVLSCGIIGTIYHIKLDLAFKSFKLKNKKTSVPVRLHIYTSCTPELPAHLLVYISVRSYTCTQQETYTHLHCLFTRTACTTVHIHTYLDIFYSFIVAWLFNNITRVDHSKVILIIWKRVSIVKTINYSQYHQRYLKYYSMGHNVLLIIDRHGWQPIMIGKLYHS